MPNGKPGDSPYTDILHHGSSEYGEPVDGFVKELSKMPGFSSVSGEVAKILWDHSPMFRQGEKESLVKNALEKLQAIKLQLSKK